MRNRRIVNNPCTTCVCSGCGVEAESIPGKRHRKCGRQTGKARVNTTRIPPLFRGTWEEGRADPFPCSPTRPDGLFQRMPSLMKVA